MISSVSWSHWLINNDLKISCSWVGAIAQWQRGLPQHAQCLGFHLQELQRGGKIVLSEERPTQAEEGIVFLALFGHFFFFFYHFPYLGHVPKRSLRTWNFQLNLYLYAQRDKEGDSEYLFLFYVLWNILIKIDILLRCTFIDNKYISVFLCVDLGIKYSEYRFYFSVYGEAGR